MSDLTRKIQEDRSPLEKLLARIPGYKGYKEMMDRRDADRMMRDYIVRLLKTQMQEFIDAEKEMISGGGLSFASKTRSAKQGFQLFIDRVNTAMPGYSGFYDSKKVGTDELERIYQFDAALITYADRFRTSVDAFDKAARDTKSDEGKTNLQNIIDQFEDLAREANETYNQRNDVITGLSSGR